MELQDFTEKEQEMIKKGLTFSKLSDKETADKIIALIPQEYIKRIPFFVRKHDRYHGFTWSSSARSLSCFITTSQGYRGSL